MFAHDAGGDNPLGGSQSLLSGRSRLPSASPIRPHVVVPPRRAAHPIVHIRTRPVLPYLGERQDQRHVWCLDHQNVVVRFSRPPSGSRQTASPPNTAGASSTPPSTGTSPARLGKVPRCERSPGAKSVASHRNSVGLSRNCSAATPCNGDRSSLLRTPPSSTTTPPRNSGRIKREEHFTFDFVHGEDATQEEVFEESVLDFMDMALLAQSIAIVCYGPTGSGKTYSMMGPTQCYSAKKLQKAYKAKDNTFFMDNRQVMQGARSRVGTFIDRSSNSGDSSITIFGASMTDYIPVTSMVPTAPGIGTATTPSKSPPLEGDEYQHPQQQPQRRSLSPRRRADATEMMGSSLSSGLSSFDMGFSLCMDFNAGPRNDMSLTGASSGQTELTTMVFTDEGSGTMGLLPRIVLILLERRGETIVLDQEEPLAKALCGNRGSSGRDTHQETQSQRHGVSLTLQELMLYGVEIYMDEFYDLLDPSKRAIPNMSDIGGLDAFCRKMDSLTGLTPRSSTGKKRSTSSGATGSGSNSNHNVPFRGGGVPISSVEDFRRCYELASRNRVTKGHQCNDTSSRSHAVFILQLQFDLGDSRNVDSGSSPATASTQSIYSYVSMVDLAGSERVKQTKVEGAALREAQYINKSLSALSAVLLALYQRASHIPYRDSKLTRLLRPCLETGNVLTLVHATPCSAEETISGLKFAEQVRHTSIQSHNFLNANTELVALFQDLRDSDTERRMEAYNKLEEEYEQLCAETRLSYLVRESEDPTQQQQQPASLSSISNQNRKMSLRQEFPHIRRREYVIGALVGRHVQQQRLMEEKQLLEAETEIEREWNLYVESVRRRSLQEVENLRMSVEKLTRINQQLAEENSQPVLRDDYVMAIKQQLKDLSNEITAYAREKLLLSEGIRVIRQRLALQAYLEKCLEEQLEELEKVVVNEGGNMIARMPVDGSVDAEMAEIYHQQFFLSKEMSLLRKESTCFVQGDGIWEGVWARAMRQELLLAIGIEMEMIEGILLSPQSLHWALETNGISTDSGRDVVFPTYCVLRNVKKLLDTFETMKKQSPASGLSESGKNEVKSTTPALPPIPLNLSNGDEVKSTATLIGCYEDERKLQETSVKKLVDEGIFCEVTCLSIGMDKLLKERLSHVGLAQETNYKPQWGYLRLIHPPKDITSYSLEFIQRTYTGSDKVWDRRVISIPLSEPQLRLKLHVIEADGIVSTPTWDESSLPTTSYSSRDTTTLPLIVLELQGVHAVSIPQTSHHQNGGKSVGGKGQQSRQSPGSKAVDGGVGGLLNSHSLISTTVENSSSHDLLLSKRLDCGGELLLPSGCMNACEEGSGCFLFQFPERLVAKSIRTESVECIVAALSGLLLPMFQTFSRDPSPGTINTSADAWMNDIRAVQYQHVPYFLLGNNDGPLWGCNAMPTSSIPPRIVMQSLGYASSTEIFFYFNREDDDNNNNGNNNINGFISSPMISHSPRSPRGRFSGPFSTAYTVLNRLGALSLSSASGGGSKHGTSNHDAQEKDEESVNETEFLLSRIQQLYAFRKKTRARVRQQIFDAEDIKAELLYSYSDSELMRGSYIKDILKEAKELIDLQQPRSCCALALRGPVHATPALCRVMCGAAVPWTIWHWAHRWKALQEVYRQQVILTGIYDMGDDDDDDTIDNSDGGAHSLGASSVTARDTVGHGSILFEELPCFLTGME